MIRTPPGQDDAPYRRSMRGRRHRVHYAWVIAAVTFVTLLGAAGFRATPSILIVPLEEEFGWSRATIAFAV